MHLGVKCLWQLAGVPEAQLWLSSLCKTPLLWWLKLLLIISVLLTAENVSVRFCELL